MKVFREILEDYGVDYVPTMERFMGNEKMYIRLLDMFFKDDNIQKLGTAIAQQDYTAAFEAAHTLKGVVGNMGLSPLYTVVCAMVEPLRAGEKRSDYADMYKAIQSEYDKVYGLRQRLKEGEFT